MRSRKQRERYDQIREQRPHLFDNPPDGSYQILNEPELVAAAESEEEVRLHEKGMPTSWSVTGVVYEDPYLIVLRDAVRGPDGRLGTYARTIPASGSAGTAVLPLCEGKIVLLRHFRHSTRSWHLEIPRGSGEVGGSTTDQARQEIREEIGAEPDHLTNLGQFHPNTGTASDQVDLFLAQISTTGAPESAEGISDIEFYTPYQVAQLIIENKITDPFTIVGFTQAWLRGLLPGLTALQIPGNSRGAEEPHPC